MDNCHRFTTIILRWFEQYGRELPWRNADLPCEKHAYVVWLSEIILQQTRIEQGRGYWERFVNRWPTVDALAAATEDEVLREWQGLGYYSRARNLLFAARQIVSLGHFPDTIEDLKKLKGVGDYTAAAIGSIVFALPVAVVDGNVYRVLARYFGVDTPINSTEGKKYFAELAQTLLPVNKPSAFNQAMMDFGAIQCTPQSPHCMDCPLTDSCVALLTDKVRTLPVKNKTVKVWTRHFNYIYVRCKGQTAIHRRPAGDIWQGLWEPVLIEDSIPADLGCAVLRKNVRHVLTHRIIVADFYLLEVNDKSELHPVVANLLEEKDFLWINESDIDGYGVPRLVEMLLESL